MHVGLPGGSEQQKRAQLMANLQCISIANRGNQGRIKIKTKGNNQLKLFGLCRLSYSSSFTVKPPNKGHFGDGPFVPCREVVLFLEGPLLEVLL